MSLTLTILVTVLIIWLPRSSCAPTGHSGTENVTITIPDDTQDHGNPRLLCSPTKWTDVATFFLANFVSHAATVKTLPGEAALSAMLRVTLALLFPASGIVRAIGAIYQYPIFAGTPLATARRAGALCMVVRSSDWQPADDDVIDCLRWRITERFKDAFRDKPGLKYLNPMHTTVIRDWSWGEYVNTTRSMNFGRNQEFLNKIFGPSPRTYSKVPKLMVQSLETETRGQNENQYFIPSNSIFDTNSRKVHGVCKLPMGYALSVVPPHTYVVGVGEDVDTDLGSIDEEQLDSNENRAQGCPSTHEDTTCNDQITKHHTYSGSQIVTRDVLDSKDEEPQDAAEFQGADKRYPDGDSAEKALSVGESKVTIERGTGIGEDQCNIQHQCNDSIQDGDRSHDNVTSQGVPNSRWQDYETREKDVKRKQASRLRRRNPSLVPGDVTFDLSSGYSLPKVLIAMFQTLYASATLYRVRGDQVSRYGYAAFGLTVAPYLIMSLINLISNTLTPEYPALYLVRNDAMDEASRRKGARFEGIVGTIPIQEKRMKSMGKIECKLDEDGAMKLRPDAAWKSRSPLLPDSFDLDLQTCEDHNKNPVLHPDLMIPSCSESYSVRGELKQLRELQVAALTAVGVSSLSIAIVEALSHFNPGHSSHAQRAWTMTWLACGIAFGPIELFIADLGHFTQKLGVCAYGAASIGGFVVVGQMLKAYGHCVQLY